MRRLLPICAAMAGTLLALPQNSIGAALSEIPQVGLTIAWSASADPTVAGYKVSYGSVSGVYTNSVSVGTNTWYSSTSLIPGATYYFIITSYNSSGLQSSPTPELTVVVPPALQIANISLTNADVRIEFQMAANVAYELQTSSDLKVWTGLQEIAAQSTGGWYGFNEPFTNTSQCKLYRVAVRQ